MMNLIIELGIVCSLVFLEQQIDLENINYDKFLYPVKKTKAKNRSINSSLPCLRPHQPGTRLRIGRKRGNRRARKKMGERSKPSGSLGRERVVEAPPPATAARGHRCSISPHFCRFCLFPHCGAWSQAKAIQKSAPYPTFPRGERKIGIKTWDIVVIPFTPFNSTKLEANHVFSCIKSVRLYEIEVLLA